MDTRTELIKQAFGGVFVLSTQLETVADRYLLPTGVTTKQWFLCLTLQNAPEAMTLSDAAQRLGTSRQNVKQLALKLQKRGLCLLETDAEDSRKTRLRLTQACYRFWQEKDLANMAFLEQLFAPLADSEVAAMNLAIKALYDSIQKRSTEK